jgi:cell division protein FtsN
LSETLQTIGQSSGTERRAYPRQRVIFSSVELPDRNGGIVLNISEHGLAMRVVDRLTEDDFAELRFQISQSIDWVEARGRIAWLDDPRTTVGVEFVHLPSEGRTLLEKWISSLRDLDEAGYRTESARYGGKAERATDRAQASVESSLPEAERVEGPEGQNKQDSAALARPAIPHDVCTSRKSGSEQHHAGSPKSGPAVAASLGVLEASPEELTFKVTPPRGRNDGRWTAAIVLLAILLLILEGLYGLSHYRRSRQFVTQELRNTSAGPAPPDAKKPTSPSRIPENAAGFVVQAGAMASRDDAVALADSLEQRDFPSFVFKRDSSRLFEVMIGPYPTAETADRVRKALESQGASTFVRSWPLR